MKLMQQSINFRFYRNFATAISKPKKSKWNTVVGLEVHAQISSKTKLFSGAGVEFAAPPNTRVSAFDAAIPGTLPVLNERCVIAGIQAALALDCTINPVSMFDRKHYFYADLPAGYQITQQRAPLAKNGTLKFYVTVPGVSMKPYQKVSRLHQLQLEQDSGKSLHDAYENRTLIDLNRAGVGLIEFVFEPDLNNGEEAAALIKELVLILRATGVCSCHMNEGALRVDANISINRHGDPLGVRTEVKNIGSVRGVAHAVDYEIQRQIDLVESGGRVHNETRSWDALSKKTVVMRDKEVLQDYRFMPEPNLPPLRLNIIDDQPSELISVERIRKSLPELPAQTRNNLIEEHGLRQETAAVLVNENSLLRYYNEILKTQPAVTPKNVANFLLNDFVGHCNKKKISVDDCQISDANLAELLTMMHNRTINAALSRIILQEMLENPKQRPSEIATAKNLKQITDPAEIEKICLEIIGKNQNAVQKHKQGKEKGFRYLMVEVAKKTEQKANMALADKIMRELLAK
ncbi:hypothetical protein HA402_011759 [Bradysia odoriphaga]|nr:hypothetical protein HA402_011759 [Bradysia odoriphaga]